MPAMPEEEMQGLVDLATTFVVTGEVRARLGKLHATPFSEEARAELENYLNSPRYVSGVESERRIHAGEPAPGQAVA